MPQVLVPIATGFEEIEAITIIDVLRRGGIEVIVASLNEALLVKGAHGVLLQTDQSLDDLSAEELDMIVLPGGWGGTKALAHDTKVQTLLREMDTKGKAIGAICAAPYALDVAGVLKEGYTCYPSVEEEIKTGGYSATESIVETGNIITSRGPATAICFALAIVKKLMGDETFEALRTGLLAEGICAEL